MEFYYYDVSPDEIFKKSHDLPKRDKIDKTNDQNCKSSNVIYYLTESINDYYINEKNFIDNNNNNGDDKIDNEILNESNDDIVENPKPIVLTGDNVIINEIQTPYNFYLILNNQDNNQLFNEFEIKLNKFYEITSNQYKLIELYSNNSSIKNNSYGIVKNPNELSKWSRVQICNHSDETISQCFFIDYGFLLPIDTNCIYKLHDCFKQFPAKSFKARLYDVYPKTEFWSLSETSFFESITKDKNLTIIIKNKNIDNDIDYYQCNLMDGNILINNEIKDFIKGETCS